MSGKSNRKMLFGSGAIKHHFPDFREPKDTDYLVEDVSQWKREKGIEYFPLVPGLEMEEIISANDQYTLTLSHSIRGTKERNWKKHLYTLRFLKEKGCTYDRSKFDQFVEFWESYHGKRVTPDFDKPNEEFFKDKVTREVSHDELHETFKFYEQPLFTYLKYDQDRANVEEKLFNDLSFADQIKTVLEEVLTVCAERYLAEYYRVGFNRTLEWLVTISPVWFSLFILDNYTLLAQYDFLWKKYVDSMK